MLPCGRIARSEQKHQRSYWNWNPCLLIQNTALYTMAGLVYSAYHGCLPERYPISHSSCFDVWHRGLPVPPHGPGMCTLWDSRLWERPAPPPHCLVSLQSLQAPNEYWRFWDLFNAAWKTSFARCHPESPSPTHKQLQGHVIQTQWGKMQRSTTKDQISFDHFIIYFFYLMLLHSFCCGL